MKNTISASLLLFCIMSQVITAQGPKRLVILHTNDMHSQLNGTAPEYEYTPLSTGDDHTTGGFSRIASLISEEKARSGDKLLVIDAGDFLMGSFFHFFEEETGFEIRLMKEMGYDVIAVGNHEFDFGPSMLPVMLRTARDKGPIPPVLLSNLVLNETDPGDDQLAEACKDGLLQKSVVLERNGLRIGFFSLLGKDAAEDAPGATPASFADPVKTARMITAELKQKEKVDLVICISHSGIEKNKKGEWSGEDVTLAEKVPDIDLIISGHTHTLLPQPLIIHGTPIVQAGKHGKHVGRLELVVEKGHAKVDSYEMINVDDRIKGSAEIQSLIDKQKQLINERILYPLHVSYNDPVVESAFDLIMNQDTLMEESTLGPFLADAIRYDVNRSSAQHADIAMIASGLICDQLLTGEQSVADLFRIVSLGRGDDKVPGYPLDMVYVNGKELKSILEILLIAYKSKPDYYIYYSGVRVHFAPWKGMLHKIKTIEILDDQGNYKAVDVSKKNPTLYSLTADSYMLEFIGILKKMSFGLVNVVPKDKTGNPIKDMKTSMIDMDPGKPGIQEGKQWTALLNYVRSFPTLTSIAVPDIPETYRKYTPRIIPLEKRK